MANITLTNLIPVPAMTSGWALTGDSTIGGFGGGSSILLEGTTSVKEKTVATNGTIALNNTHIYYARCYGYQETLTSGATMGFYWPIAEPFFNDTIPIQGAGHWRLYSAVNHRNEFTNGSYPFRIDFNNNFVAGKSYVSSPMLIDLTACFGAGNEPTKEWLDEHIPFFSGSRTFNDDIWKLKNITPVMTSNTTPTGYVASASTEVSTPRQAWCAFDSLSAPDQEIDRWHSGVGVPQWIMLKFPEKHTVNYFSIKNCGDQHNGINAFTLQGSNDGSNFVDLGSYTNPKDFGITTYYEVTNKGSYQYYRLNISSTHHNLGTASSPSYYCIIDQINFYEKGISNFVKVDGVWREIISTKIKVNNVWKNVKTINCKSGVWK